MTLSQTKPRTNGQVEAFLEGQRMRADYIEKLGEEGGSKRAQDLANALFRDGRNDSLSMQAEIGPIIAKFPETWGYIAGGLDPLHRNEDGSLLNAQC